MKIFDRLIARIAAALADELVRRGVAHVAVVKLEITHERPAPPPNVVVTEG